MRICSFLPAATEIVYALGLGEELYGVTHECDYPPEAKGKPVVIESLIDSKKLSQGEIDELVSHSIQQGHQLYGINRDLLKRIKPDVIITQELCDVCSVSYREVLKATSEVARECEVISLAPRGLFGVIEDVVTIGRACKREERAMSLAREMKARIAQIEKRTKGLRKRRVFSLEWFDPIFASGHWVPEMVSICGGRDDLASPGEDSRRVTWDEVLSFDPEVVVLMPCGFSVARTLSDLDLLTKRRGWEEMEATRNGRVYATNGAWYYSRPGPRLIDGLEFMARMIQPEEFGEELPSHAAVKVSLQTSKLSTG